MTLVLAHRGSGMLGPEPENSLAAFAAARRLGADGVELDVRRSREGGLFVHHDAALGDGRLISELSGEELGAELCSLEEALSCLEGLLVNVEVKNWPDDPDYDPQEVVARETARLLRSRPGRVVVSSFSTRSLSAFRKEAPEIETAWLAGSESIGVDLLAKALEEGVSGIHPHDLYVTAELVAEAHLAGLAVRVWTVDRPERAIELAGYGVEAVITNDVAAVLGSLRGGGLAKNPPGREQCLP